MRLAVVLVLAGLLVLAGCQGAVEPDVSVDGASDGAPGEQSDGVFQVEEDAPSDLDIPFDEDEFSY